LKKKIILKKTALLGVLLTSIFLIMFFGTNTVYADLVGHWNFEEESGSTVKDLSGNGNDGTIYDADRISGKRGMALGFDGSDDVVTIASPTGLSSSTGSIEFWMKVNSAPQTYYTVFQFYETHYTDYIACQLDLYGVLNLIIEDNNEHKVNVSYDLDKLPDGYVGKWIHIQWVQDGTEVKLYINGERKALDIYGGSVNSGDWWTDHLTLSLGRFAYGWRYFDGAIDDFRIYNQPPSDLDIFNRFLGKYICAYWDFDEGSGSTVTDLSDNDNDGTRDGASWISGVKETALEFDGSDDVVTIASATGLASSTGSIQFWMKANSVPPIDYTVFEFYEVHPKNYIACNLNLYGVLTLVIKENYEYRVNVSYDLDNLPDGYIGEWIHVQWIQDGTEVKLYINGERKALDIYGSSVNSKDWWTNDLNLSLGRFAYGWRYFDGAIDEFIMQKGIINEDDINNSWLYSEMRTCWNMNEGTGLETYDFSGNGNTASFVNMSSNPWNSGILDYKGYYQHSLGFNGSNDYISIANSESLQLTGDLTISLWIKPSTIGVKQCNLIDKNYGGEFSLVLDQDGAVQLLQGKSQTSGEYFSATVLPSNSVVNGNWHHIVVTRDMTTNEIKGYLDGQLKSTVTYTDNSSYYPPVATTSTVKVGSGYISEYNGEIDNVKIYGRILELEEIEVVNLLSAYPTSTYYTSESLATVVCHMNIASTAGITASSSRLVAKNSQNSIIGMNNSPDIDTDLTCSLSSLSTGNNAVTIEFQHYSNSSWVKMFSCTVNIRKLTSGAGTEVKVDRKNNFVLKDGVPFFPIALYMYCVTAYDTAVLEDVSDAGFNTVIHWESIYIPLSPDYAEDYIDVADDYGLLVIDKLSSYASIPLHDYRLYSPDDFWYIYESYDEEIPASRQYERMVEAVSYIKGKDNLLAYYNFDEPTESQTEAITNLYERVNTEDGHHPVINCGIERNKTFDSCDIRGTGSYWCPPFDASNIKNTLNSVTREACRTSEEVKRTHKAFWAIVMSEYYVGSHKRIITPDEQRSQTYLTLIHGAKGVCYFRSPIFHEDTFNTFKGSATISSLIDELNDLAPSILTPDLDQSITYSSGSEEQVFDPTNGEFVDIQVSLRKAPAGEDYDYVFLATNTKPYPIGVNYTISLLGSSGTINNLFNTSTYTFSNGSFSDTLSAYATRAYTFDSSSTAPVVITVNMTPPDPMPTLETAEPRTGRSGKTNLMQNPSFENATIANWPDYCWPAEASPRVNAANQGWGQETTSDLSGLCAEIENYGGDSDGTGDPGSYCLKITKTSNVPYNECRINLAPEHSEVNSQYYTFSVYLKTDAAGAAANGGQGVEIRLGFSPVSYIITNVDSTSWKRYDFKCLIPAHQLSLDYYSHFYLRLYTVGTIWADAVQVEKGDTATGFRTD